jgi:hypothetical protein
MFYPISVYKPTSWYLTVSRDHWFSGRVAGDFIVHFIVRAAYS